MQTACVHLLQRALNDEGASCQELILKIINQTGSMKTLCMKVRVKINHLIVVGANCLSSSLIKSFEWWRCQLSRTIIQEYEEDWKHEDIVYESKGQDHPLVVFFLPESTIMVIVDAAELNSSWRKLPEFISYKELWMMKVPAVKNYYSKLWRRLEAQILYGSKGKDHPPNSSWCKLPEFISYKDLWIMKVPAIRNYYSRSGA